MIATVYRPSRLKDGRRVVGRMYRGKYRLDPREKIKDVPLYTNDKQVAQQNLRKILEEDQNERAGFIRPKKQREAVQQPKPSGQYILRPTLRLRNASLFTTL